MTTAYSNLLGLALPVTGELSGTWGDTVNDYITKYLDDAIANAQVISGSQTAVTLSKTTGTALVAAGSGSTGSAQYALIRCTGNPASTLTITVSYASLTNSQFSKTYLIFNSTSTNQSVVVQATTSSGTSTGVTITAGERALIAWNGTDFVKIATQSGTGEFVTVDTTNLEVTNIKAKDGTAAATIADSTGAITVSTLLNVDNLRLDGNTLSSTDSNGNVVLAPNGTGDVQLDADTVRVGDSAAAVTLTSNGAGALTVTTGGAADLILNTNSGTNSGSITIGNGTNGNITVATNGTGDFYVDADTVRIGDSNANATITTNGTGDLILNTNSGTNSGSITIEDGVNGNIIIAPNGTGQVQISNAALDLTTIEVTNIKAKDGTASITLADATGVATFSANPILNAGTANGVPYLSSPGKVLTTGSALTFDGTGALSLANTGNVIATIQSTSTGGTRSATLRLNVASTGGDDPAGKILFTYGSGFTEAAAIDVTHTNPAMKFSLGSVEKMRLFGSSLNIGGNFTSTNNTLQVTGNAAIGYTTAAPTTGLIVAGDVGIGTDSPTKKLHVVGNARLTPSSGDGELEILSPAGSGSRVYFGEATVGDRWVIGSPGGSGDFVFRSGASNFSSGNERMRLDSSGTLILRQSSNAANTSVSFNTTVQDALTLDSSGNLLVGTTSTSLENSRSFEWIGSSGGVFRVNHSTSNGSGDPYFQFGYNASQIGAISQSGTTALSVGSANELVLCAGGTVTERARIDASGNLVVGKTSGSYRFDLQGAAGENATLAGFFSGTNTNRGLTLGLSAGGGAVNDAYVVYNSTVAGGYAGHIWQAAGTERARIDASGNLLVGATSANSFRFKAVGTGGNLSGNAYFVGLFGDGSASAKGVGLGYDNSSQTGIVYGETASAASNLAFWTYSGSAWGERARITADGDLLVGNTTQYGTANRAAVFSANKFGLSIIDTTAQATGVGGALNLGGNYRTNGDAQAFVRVAAAKENSTDNNYAYAMTFSTTPNGGTFTEAARITSGGYFKASNSGTYANSAGLYHEFYNSIDGTALYVSSPNANQSSDSLLVVVDRNTTNNSFYAINYYNNGAAAYKFRVADSGNVTNTNGTYGTISDAKMKTDIVDAGSQWSDIKALRFRKFKMKDDPSGLVQLGVVAQEVELTSPGLVDEHADKDAQGNDLGTTTKSVKTSILLMKAAVALQEAMARIEQLEAKVAALEAK